MSMDIEFKRGDKVTVQMPGSGFKTVKLPAKVCEIVKGYDELKYRLEGDGVSLVTITSPRGIVESKYFEDIGEFKW